MSITITTDVVCDRCANWYGGATGAAPLRMRARRAARACGWTRKAIDGEMLDLCPTCSDESVSGLS